MKEYRVSHYIISTRVAEDKYILVHGYSGAVDLVDADIAKQLIKGGIIRPDDFDDETLDTLYSRGYLTERSYEEEVEYVARMSSLLHRRSGLIYKAFTFVVTYDCNFRCPYCFERYNVANNGGCSAMSIEVVDAAYKAIESENHNCPTPSHHITLFGGEPLLKENLPIIEYIVEQGVRRGFKFSAITNGYDLNHFVHLLGQDKIGSVQITVDGLEIMHNSKRVHRDGVPTFNRIIENIGIALDHNIAVNIRFNTDKQNFDEMISLKQYLEDLKFSENTKFSFESARLDNPDSERSLETFYSQREFIAAHESSNQRCEYKDYGAYARLYSAVSQNKPLPYKAAFCGAQHGSLVFDPLYKLYPCWEVLGNRNHEIGSFRDGTIVWNNENRSNWSNKYIATIPECLKCPCALLCGGGCVAHSLDKHHCTHMTELIHSAAKRLYHNFILNRL